jgi:hypothetical protein
VGGHAPRARGDSVRPRRLSGASARLSFTVRCHGDRLQLDVHRLWRRERRWYQYSPSVWE